MMTIVEIVIVFVVSTAAESIHVMRRRRRMRQRHDVTSWYLKEHRDPRDAAPVDASVFAAALARNMHNSFGMYT